MVKYMGDLILYLPFMFYLCVIRIVIDHLFKFDLLFTITIGRKKPPAVPLIKS
jgi:hypothetical protein